MKNSKEDGSAVKGTSWKRISFFSLVFAFFIYSYYIYRLESPGDISAQPLAQKGKLLFQEYNCGACHQLYGLGGYMGPDLTNVISDKSKGEAYAYALIKNGTNKMPNLRIADTDIRSLVEYLKAVDKTGRWPARDFTHQSWGDVDYHQ